MASLMDVPGLSGYLQAQQIGTQQNLGQLAQVGQIQGILSRQKAMQEEEQIKGVLSQSGGDPQVAIKKLVEAGTPASLGLAAKLHSLAPKADPVSIGAGGLRMPDGTIIPPAARPNQEPKAKWSEPYVLNGVTVQKDENSGQIRTAVTREPQIRITQPPAPSVKDIVDPLDPSKMIAVDTRTFNEDAYRRGNRTGVIGTSGREPSYAKKADEKAAGVQNLKDTVSMLNDAYTNLESAGAGVSPKQGMLKNVYERAAASGLGQTVAGAVGTTAQTERDKIAMARANLMAAMKQATGMSAQALNSNAELMFYLQAATDPSKSREANKAALAYMDKRFKLGLGIQGDPKALASPSASGTIAPPPPEGFKPL